MLRQLEHTTWLAASAAQQPGGAHHAAPRWDWALSVVHSRTFGAPGRGGGVGVRMLVPLVDMLNHVRGAGAPGGGGGREGAGALGPGQDVRPAGRCAPLVCCCVS